MIKQLFLLVVMINSVLFTKGQNFTIGKPYPVVDAKEKLYFSSGGEILSIKITGEKVYLQKMDAVNLTFKKSTLYTDFPKGYNIELITEWNKRYYIFYSFLDKGREKLISREIDFGSLTFRDSGKILVNENQKIASTSDRLRDIHTPDVTKYNFFKSYDSTLLAVQYRFDSKTEEDETHKDLIGVNVFDKELTQRWSRKVTMPYAEKKMDNLTYTVASNGNVYTVAKVFDDNSTAIKKRTEEVANYHLEIFAIKSDVPEIEPSVIGLGDKFINNLWLYEIERGGVACVGYYNSGKEEQHENADGVVIIKSDSEGKWSNRQYYEIPLEIINQYEEKTTVRKNIKEENKGNAELKGMSLRKIIMDQDGGIIVIGEQRFMGTAAVGTTNIRVPLAVAGHLILMKISKEGDLMWTTKIPKWQDSATGFKAIDYYLHPVRKYLYFFMLDADNTALQPDKSPIIYSGADGILTMIKINKSTGAMSRSTLFNTTEQLNGMALYQIKAFRFLAVSADKIIFEAYKKKGEDVLVKISLD